MRLASPSACHEHAGGYAFNRESMFALADKARAAGAEIRTGVTATGFSFDASGASPRCRPIRGRSRSSRSWWRSAVIASLWEMLGLPDRLDVRQPDGTVATDQPMWTYWYLQEGELFVDPASFVTADGRPSGVIHLDSDQALLDDDGTLITDEPWGVYFKPDRASIQGGAAPIRLGTHSMSTRTRPARSTRLPRHVVRGVATASGGFAGTRRYRQVRSGGVGAFTVDSSRCPTTCGRGVRRRRLQPRLQDDRGRREIARILSGEESSLLAPFRYERFQTGDLHPVSHSPYPWS